jgi:hypothetical protein
MSINELFGATNEMNTAGSRGLPGTAELTSVAHNAAIRMMKAMEADIETWTPRIKKSATDSHELDAIIEELCDYHVDDESILRYLSDEQVEGMLKSQQSKRSRSKSKAMTVDNYITLLTAAIAETILRDLYNKPKSAGGFKRATGSVDYTIEQLQALGEDQEALRKEIRNIQSKKSIMKSKADFDESDERWLALLKAEQQLKDMRIGGRSGVVEVDRTKDALSDLLAGKDISKMKSAEAHELLERIAQLAATDMTPQPVDVDTAEEIQ